MSGKYDRDLDELARRLAEGEPWFVLRGQDLLAPQAIAAYAELLRKVGEDEQARRVEGEAIAVLRWQSENRDRVKVPD